MPVPDIIISVENNQVFISKDDLKEVITNVTILKAPYPLRFKNTRTVINIPYAHIKKMFQTLEMFQKIYKFYVKR